VALATLLFLIAPALRADDKDPNVAKAREEFTKGNEAGKHAQWAEALASFERSAALRPHAVTTFNIGVCQRAMGNYTLARDTLLRALEQNQKAGGGELADSLAAEDRAFVTQIDELLATVNVTLEPESAAVTVDGRPLAARGELMVAGIREPGHGDAAPGRTFKLLLNPGVHVITLARPGFAESVVHRTFAPGSTTELGLQLDRLPAVVHVAANQEGAVVTVDDRDVGTAPVDVSRPAGTHHVAVHKAGFKRYETDIRLEPGQELTLDALLVKEEKSLVTQWWFWTIAGVAVAGVGVGTYALTRGESTTQEPLNGGGLGWTVKLR
jgi:hypothetical protein